MKTWNRLERNLLVAFLLWSMAGFLFLILGISPGTIVTWSLPEWLKSFIIFCLNTGDPTLIILAFANTHLHAARQWPSAGARRWGLYILIGSLGVETVGACTGWPFGSYHYTGNFGPLLGVVPMTIPLAWYVVVTNSLFIVRAVLPHAPRWGEALLTGLLCTIYDFILEPFATLIKHYWVWRDNAVPLQNYIAWFVLSGLLTWFFAPTASIRFRCDPRPVLILVATLLIFLTGEAISGGPPN